MESIPVHIINLKKRIERKSHILKQFSEHPEFEPILIEAIECSDGAVGLWMTIIKILKEGRLFRDNCIIICEDDHEFTKEYSTNALLDAIKYVSDNNGDVLFAGISWLNNAVPVAKNIYWVEKSSGTQFMVIFKHFFNSILKEPFSADDAADTKISVLSDKKYFISPYLSIQKEFGYSDVTPKNSLAGRVDKLFDDSLRKTRVIDYLYKFYKNLPLPQINDTDIKGLLLQVFIFIPSEVEKRNCRNHFNENDFLLHYIISPHENIFCLSNLKLAIETAIEKKEDIILLCRDDVHFTHFYSAMTLLTNIFLAQKLSAEILIGGAEDFEIAVPVTENLFWINHFFNTPFVVIYKSAFEKILSFEPNDIAMEELNISSLLSNKLLLHPYVVNFEKIMDKVTNDINLSRIIHKTPSERLDLIKSYAQS